MPRLFAAVQLAFVMAWAIPAQAQVRQNLLLEIYQGHGITLNFRPTGETIHKVWLDDPSQVTLDFDDANCLGNGESQATCAAKVLHLRRIQRLNFPHLPTTPTTTLTVVTDRNLYTFRLTYPSIGSPKSSILDIQSALQTPTTGRLSANRLSGVKKIEQGLQVARSRHLIQPGDALWQRLQSLLNLIQMGTPVTQAAQQVGVSQALLIRLIELSAQSNPL
jgi:hypothetical protein